MGEEKIPVDMSKAVDSLKNYWNTYDRQPNYEIYTAETLIDDALYGLGIAIDKERFRFAQGYDKFKEIILNHLKAE